MSLIDINPLKSLRAAEHSESKGLIKLINNLAFYLYIKGSDIIKVYYILVFLWKYLYLIELFNAIILKNIIYYNKIQNKLSYLFFLNLYILN